MLVAYIGFKYFYYVPENTGNLGVRGSILQAVRSVWGRIDPWPRLLGMYQTLMYYLRFQRWLALIIMVVMVSGALTLSLKGRQWLERPSSQETQFTSKAQLALLEEKLVPPPPLPPSIFLGSNRPALESADRDWDKLQPGFRQALLALMQRLAMQGYEFVLLEGYRSPERQDKLAALGGHVTQARAFESRHQFGLAADLAPMRNGALVFNFDDPWGRAAYQSLGEEAKRMGMIWGGNWKLQDYGHIELRS